MDARKLRQERFPFEFALALGLLCVTWLTAASSQARVLESTNGPRITVGAAGHAYTKDELAKESRGKAGAKKQKTAGASKNDSQEAVGKE
ncbi:MAG: hypothetical protein AB7T14_04245 [Candidatus Methylacidiphilaceae bacterium]